MKTIAQRRELASRAQQSADFPLSWYSEKAALALIAQLANALQQTLDENDEIKAKDNLENYHELVELLHEAAPRPAPLEKYFEKEQEL